MMLQIQPAVSEAHFRDVRGLLAEHIAWDTQQTTLLGFDKQEILDFYYASGEVEVPGAQAPPDGCLLLATYSGHAAGCVAFHRMTPDACEMKWMYVRPAYRSKRVGRQLTQALLTAARTAGYSRMRLETTTFMDKAIAMYSSLGFERCQPYYVIPEAFRPVTLFMELDLSAAPNSTSISSAT
jgi:ribosomal protein S18 acetylase RimI-like enzyme